MIDDIKTIGRPASRVSTATTADRRIILLLGTPRSGTTWLASILNSHERVVYSHEPLSKLRIPHLAAPLERLRRGGTLESGEREALIAEWCKAHHTCRRPPFFAKEFSWVPPAAFWLSWAAVRLSEGWGDGLYRRLYSPNPSRRFDLLIKEIGWLKAAESIVHSLDPYLIVIIRHPCAVVASRRRGQQLGMLNRHNREVWFDRHGELSEPLGYDRTTVMALEAVEFLALDWLLQNRAYQAALRGLPCGDLVVYETLCRDPVGVTRQVFAGLGWEPSPQTLRYLRGSTREDHLGVRNWLSGNRFYFRLNRDPAKSADSWRKELSQDETKQVLAISRNLPEFETYFSE